jgi:hypothetical protein
MLLDLCQKLSKKGHGTFRVTLQELGIPKSTAMDYILLYRVENGFQPKPKKARMAGNRTNHVKDLHQLKDLAGEFLRLRPEDVPAFWQWLETNFPKK